MLTKTDTQTDARPLAVSIGEPAGIGPDIVLQAWTALRRQPSSPNIIVFGDPNLLESRAMRLGLSLSLKTSTLTDSSIDGSSDRLCILDVGQMPDKPGELDPSTGGSTVAALHHALDAIRAGHCSGLVTAPIHKANLYVTGFGFPGHTEFLEHYARQHWPEHIHHAVMMLAGPELRTVPVTVHVPLRSVAETLNCQHIVDTGKVVARDLAYRFGIENPRLAVAGLNPHAGENGTMGEEDDAIIAPAVTLLNRAGIKAIGPLPADTMFHREAREGFDAALCMYHDQALIPVKTLDFHNTVNVTLGLPFVRTSPDHGTALSLAGTGRASPDSMIAAIKLATQMVQRARHSA